MTPVRSLPAVQWIRTGGGCAGEEEDSVVDVVVVADPLVVVVAVGVELDGLCS